MQAISNLHFDEITPSASRGLGGLVRDHFGNGRLFATACPRGGLTDISQWGRQHLDFSSESYPEKTHFLTISPSGYC
jgi:hypothetical protein